MIKFVWVTSHVGSNYNDTVDRLAKEACHLPSRGAGRPALPDMLSLQESAPLLTSLYGAAKMQRGPAHHYHPPLYTSLFDVVCRQLLDHIVLENILLHHSRFGGWK